MPPSLDAMLRRVSAGVMSAPTGAMFGALVCGSIRQTGERTVCGMLRGAGLSRRVRHQRAHRFFSHARWDEQALGCAVSREIVAGLGPDAALEVVVDGSLYRRSGPKVAGASWYHDPTANSKRPVSAWGTSFVIASIICQLDFMERAIALPALATMHDKHAPSPASHPQIARTQLETLAREHPTRMLHGIGDAEFACKQMMRELPDAVTFTSRLKSNAALYALRPPPTGKRGRPAEKGVRLGSLTQIAHDPHTVWRDAIVERYGKTERVQLHAFTCLWWGVTKHTPVRIVMVRDPDKPTKRGYQIAAVSTDHAATAAELVERYARRWPCETAYQDAKHVAGVGDPQNRHPTAVRRTVPFQLLAMTLMILWYARSLYHPDHVALVRADSPWWSTKRAPSVTDMYHTTRRILITSEISNTSHHKPTHEQIHHVTTAWALAAA